MNIGWDLPRIAANRPDQIAVVEPNGWEKVGVRKYRTITFRELEEDSSRITRGLQEFGVTKGTRMALLVRPGIDFVKLVFALFKSGAVTILIDPGMGRQHLVNCLADAKPDGFVAIPKVHAVRLLKRKRFPQAKLNVTLGRRWFWGGKTVKQLLTSAVAAPPADLDLSERDLSEKALSEKAGEDPAAIIFTTGSTGPPKGVLYRHRNFAQQVRQIRDQYQIQPGEVDLAGFPLFGLFNSAMGVTTVFPEMDFTRPADVNPEYLLQHAEDWSPTQSFGSPALWNTVGRYCEEKGRSFPTIRRVLSAGAPVPPHVLNRIVAAIGDGGEVHTPYGATEALPVATISSTEIVGETAAMSQTGAGTCVGRHFDGIQWKVISITDEPISEIDQVEPLGCGEIGELIVRGPVVTSEYITRTDANPLSKIQDRSHAPDQKDSNHGCAFWHRMGDCGYLDDQDRFWFCGRKSHRVVTEDRTMFTVPCEAIANGHAKVYRSALVGISTSKASQSDGTSESDKANEAKLSVMIVELWPEHQSDEADVQQQILDEVHQLLQASELTRGITREHVLLHPGFPVDIRHNAKIFREQLGPWAEKLLQQATR